MSTKQQQIEKIDKLVSMLDEETGAFFMELIELWREREAALLARIAELETPGDGLLVRVKLGDSTDYHTIPGVSKIMVADFGG